MRLVALDSTVGLTVASALHYAWLVAHQVSSPGNGHPTNK
jgi:hypothetical protein